ncbi:hypothetical protein [Paenibacillus protaetiae]|uniref:Uncharacterized protein n=1 Tax=Paenibacillus protaetiae TaxID=2509456 RepID=A0A4P6F8Q9_9BACL|nr:hypothetical protein [Paenibacillus protaetiae]QAY66838.1 hypothetical protein ET464_10985 [Paenibacillus protaetiae]
MSLFKVRHMGMETKYSVLSLLSLSGVVALHLLHWLAAPALMESMTGMEMHAHHQHGGAEPGSSLLQSTLMMLLFIVNVISVYFAVRQLVAAYRQKGGYSLHKLACSGSSVLVLAMTVYLMFKM